MGLPTFYSERSFTEDLRIQFWNSEDLKKHILPDFMATLVIEDLKTGYR